MKLYSLSMAYPNYITDKEVYFINTQQYTQEEFKKLVEKTARDFRDDNTKTWYDVFDKIVLILVNHYGFVKINNPCEVLVEASCEIPRLNVKK